jgi:sirohydrochlorin ferrochelatase
LAGYALPVSLAAPDTGKGHPQEHGASDADKTEHSHERMPHTEYFACYPSESSGKIGALILAHGGTERWDRLVTEAAQPLKEAVPVCIAFGMAFSDSAYIQGAVAKLEQSGVHEIRVLPLFISSSGAVPRQMEYIFGRSKSPGVSPVSRVQTSVRIRYLSPIDGDARAGKVMRDFAMELSADPRREAVFLVAHGPVSDEDDAEWRSQLRRMGKRVKSAGFASVEVATIRDDAPPEVRAAVVEDLRARIRNALGRHRVIVVPVLISSTDIHDRIERDLAGLDVTVGARGLVEHPDFPAWMKAKFGLATTLP